jgi:hemerythrin-like domain-containing protein
MNRMSRTRRAFFRTGFTAAGIVLVPAIAKAQAKQTVPVEDLMRDHGILRRALLVCRYCASRLRSNQTKALGKPLHDTAALFAKFGGDYHEKAVEEQLVFPTIMKGREPLSKYPAVLTLQHARSREFLSYLEGITKSGSIPRGDVQRIARQLDAFESMYHFHTAFEDTVLFPAWKDELSDQAYAEMQQRFVEIERKIIGESGYNDALNKIAWNALRPPVPSSSSASAATFLMT